MSVVPVDVLAVGAHPDDAELGCGATLATFAAKGRSFGILDLTRGEMGTRGTPEVRAQEAAEAARILGATFRETLDLRDGGLRTDREAELQVIDVIRKSRPKLVLSMPPSERHPDHARAARLVTEASFYAGLRSLETGVAAHRPQQVVYYFAWTIEKPSFLVDVSGQVDTWLKAVEAYKSQFYDPRSKDPQTKLAGQGFVEFMVARLRVLGMQAGVQYAEGFVTSLPPRLDDPVAAFAGYEP